MEEKLKRLKAIVADLTNLGQAAALLGWDQQVNMPPGAAEDRGNQLSTLARMMHEMAVSDEAIRLVDELVPYADTLDPDSDDARFIKVVAREQRKHTKVPARHIVEFTQVTTQAHNIWAEARQENNFKKFQPMLERIVELRREYASFFAPYDHVYDPLLDDFEPGLKTADVKAIFDALRPQQVEIIQAIRSRPQVENGFLHQPYDEKDQWEFGVEVIKKFGYDFNHGRIDKAAHPFTSGFGIGDVRITTRVNPNYLGSCLFADMHEAGHAMYEQGVDRRFSQTPLGTGASLAVHESQSRMWENLVGRSKDFWIYAYPLLQKRFPAQLGNVSLDTFYKGINRVQPSLIRVEADEATYNLHIMLRLELEIALIEGTIDVKDLPQAWNYRIEQYLGITPPNDSVGVLQDVHWSGGMIGYFSTYALGNLISSQLWEVVNRDIPSLSAEIRKGEFGALLGWLREKIHQHGAKYQPQELVQMVTGSKIDPAPYVRYLRTKYGEIYGF